MTTLTSDSTVTEDARTLMRLIFERQGAGLSTLDEDLRTELTWKQGRYTDAREELRDLDAIQNIFLPVPLIGMLADTYTAIVREVLRDGRTPVLWQNQTEPYRAWVITQASNVISNRWATAKDIHEDRRATMIAEGWKYGATFNEKDKVSDEIKPWEEMPVWYRMTYIIFVNTVRTLAREPR